MLESRGVFHPVPGGGSAFQAYGLWAPGVLLFRRLRFQAKAGLISMVFLIPVVALAWPFFSSTHATIQFTEREREGLVYVRAAVGVLQTAQEVRRQPADATAQKGLASALENLSRVERELGERFGSQKRFAALQAAVGAHPATAKSDRLEQLALALIADVTDASNLSLDPDLETYSLMDAAVLRMPELSEQLARLVSLGAPVLASAEAPPALIRELDQLVALSNDREAAALLSLEKVLVARPELKPVLPLQKTSQALEAFKAKSLNGEQFSAGIQGDGEGYKKAGAAVAVAVADLQDKSLVALDTLLEERIHSSKLYRYEVLALLIVSLMLSAYLFRAFAMVMGRGLSEIRRHLDQMARGDLATLSAVRGTDEISDVMRDLSAMQGGLRHLVAKVRESAESLGTACAQISAGVHDLSSRTEQAAASLEESASAMEEFGSTVSATADNTLQASSIASENATVAQRGGHAMQDMVVTMHGIHESSTKIANIIGVIDSIAFQTNILALNAAVEAARAGEQGRGFAVVASEVRQLAQRSASAAREIQQLIGSSVEQVQAGASAATNAGTIIAEIVTGAGRVSALLSNISTATNEQRTGVQQVGRTILELDRGTQQNAALVEQTAAAAASVRERAVELVAEVQKFVLEK